MRTVNQQLSVASELLANANIRKGLDVNKTALEFQLARLVASYMKLDRQLGVAITKGRKTKIEYLVTQMLDKKAKIENVQLQVNNRGLILNLTNDPKSARLPNTSSYAGRVQRRGHTRTLVTPSKHGKPDTYSIPRDKGLAVKHKPETRELQQDLKQIPVPTFRGDHTVKQKQYADFAARLKKERGEV